jgi:hypothetical protein
MAALAPAGVRDLVVRAGFVHGLARNYRAGQHAVLLVHEALLARPDLSGFFIAHEAAHLARNDLVRRPVVFSAALASWVLLAVAWPVAVLALPLLIVLAAVFNRRMEFSCDRWAARWVGVGQSELALSVVARDREHRGLLRALRSLLTYPSPKRRLAVVRAVAAGPSGLPVAGPSGLPVAGPSGLPVAGPSGSPPASRPTGHPRPDSALLHATR